MKRPEESAERWTRLLTLLAPVHERTRVTARRLARTSADGDDLFQEAVLRAYSKLPSLREESRFSGWFYAVLLSVHRSRARRAAWRRFLSLEHEMEHGFDPPDAAGVRGSEERWRADRASRALASLPAVQREAVVLFDIEGYSIEEIAAWQKASVPAVKARLRRGRARLRRYYERELARPANAGIARRESGHPLEEGRSS
jgi:RNA polymerase sigma-70 factor, ECF subfamily